MSQYQWNFFLLNKFQVTHFVKKQQDNCFVNKLDVTHFVNIFLHAFSCCFVIYWLPGNELQDIQITVLWHVIRNSEIYFSVLESVLCIDILEDFPLFTIYKQTSTIQEQEWRELGL